jgi:hypothetical protein
VSQTNGVGHGNSFGVGPSAGGGRSSSFGGGPNDGAGQNSSFGTGQSGGIGQSGGTGQGGGIGQPLAPPAGQDRPMPRRGAGRPMAAPEGQTQPMPQERAAARAARPSAVDDRKDRLFDAFYRGYLPHLMSHLMVQGARPAAAAELAQGAMAAAYKAWDQIPAPEEWTRNWAMNAFRNPSSSTARAWEAPPAGGPARADSGSLFDPGRP